MYVANILYGSKDKLKELIEEAGSKYAVCIEFLDAVETKFYDKGLQYYRDSGSSVDRNEKQQTLCYHDEAVGECLISTINKFIELCKLNQSSQAVSFVVTSSTIKNTADMPQSKCNLLIYSLVRNECTPFTAPCKPKKPLAAIKNKSEIILKCDFEEIASIENYHVAFYAEADHINIWNIKAPFKKYIYEEKMKNLQPNTTYVFKIAAEYKSCPLLALQYSDESEPITTPDYVRYIARPGKPQVCRIQPNAITLRWEESQKTACVDDSVQYYIIHYASRSTSKDNNGITYWNIVETSDTTAMITVDDIIDNLPYLFKVVAVGKCGISKESEESDVITIKDHIPSKPGKPTVLASSRDSITITWDVPQCNAHLVTQYIVKCFLHGSSKDPIRVHTYKPDLMVHTAHVTSETVNLRSGELYVFQVFARTNNGISGGSESSEVIETIDKCSPPGKPMPVIMPQNNMIKLTWDAPLIHSHLVKNYYVECYTAGQTLPIETKSSLPEYIYDHDQLQIKANQQYRFRVTACDCNGKRIACSSELSNPVTVSNFTVSDDLETSLKPGKPEVTGIYIDDEDTELILSWSKPTAKTPIVIEQCVILQCCLNESKEYSKIKNINVTTTHSKVKQLQQSYQYKFKIGVMYEGRLIHSEESNIVTISREISCPGKPDATSVTENSISLSWTQPNINHNFIKVYSIIVMDQKGGALKFEKSDATKAKITKLSPNMCYKFKIIAEGKFGFDSEESEESDLIFTKLVSGIPGKPEECGVSHDEVSLCWQPPAGNITHYCVYYNSLSDYDFGQVYTSNREPQALITYLQPNTSYTFSVVSMCARDGTSACSDISENSEPVKTKPYACSKPGEPQVIDVNYDEAILSCTEPQENSEVVKVYVMVCYLKKTVEEVASKEIDLKESIKMCNLQPNTEYTFAVIAHCESGASVTGPRSKPITTMKIVCTPPGRPILTKVTHNSISLKWHEPTKNARLVKQYIIYKSSDDSSKAQCYKCVTKNEAIIIDLIQNSGYYFHIEADCNENISDSSPKSEVIYTKKACSQPGRPFATNFTYNSISLKWEKPTSHPEIVERYIVECCEHPNISYETKATIITVENLSPCTSYNFEVIAHCDDDVDIRSNASDPVTTDKAVCSDPRSLTIEKATEYSVLVQWSAPQTYKELVECYIVSYQKQTDSNSLWINVGCSEQTQMEITELEADTAYTIKVQVQQNARYGLNESCHSEAYVAVKTLPDVCSIPGVPRCTGSTYNRIMLTWEEPQQHKHLVQKYNVTLHNGTSSSKETPGSKPEIVIYDLKPNTAYKFTVAAICELKTSEESGWSDAIKTEEEICSEPGIPTVLNTSCNSITLTWSKPAKCAHIIQKYTIYHTFISKNYEGEWQTLTTSEVQEKKVIDSLQSDTGYYFKVQAVCTNNRKSKFSDCSEKIQTRKKKLITDLRSKLDRVSSSDDELICLQLDRFMTKSVKNEDLMISKYTFGKQSPNHKEKILLLLGATGSGKSTMINGIVNYIFGVEWEDDCRLKLIHQETELTQAYSQTKWITSYTFHWEEGFPFPYTLTVIDTPGFGDTDGGIERDKRLVCQIKKFFELKFQDGGMEHVHGIGFLTQSSAFRLTKTQKYIYDSMLSLFGKDVANNIFIMATFSDGGSPQILKSIKKAGIPTDKQLFSFNNGSLFQSPEESKAGDTFWLMGVETFQKFFTVLGKTEATSIQLSKEVLQEREKLEAIVSGLTPQVYNGLSKLDELAQTKCILQQNEELLKDDKNFTIEIEVSKYRPVPLPKGEHVTNCRQCNITCHHPCYIPDTGQKQKCYAMHPQGHKNACCRVCPKKCPWQQHENARYRFERYTETQSKTSTELKEKYTKNVDDKESLVTKLDEEMNGIYQNIVQDIHDINRCLQIIRKKALKADCITDIEYIDLLIQSEEQRGEKGYQGRVEYLKQIQKDIKTFNVVKEFKPESMDRDRFFQEFREWKETKRKKTDETEATYTCTS